MSFGGGGGGSGNISTSGDVALNNPADSQLLAYNSTLGKWQNATYAGPAVNVPRPAGGTWPSRPGATVVIWIETNPAAPKVPAAMVDGDLYFGPDGMAGLAAGGTP